jgi:MFS family permease
MGTATLLMGLLPWAIAFWACGVAAGVFVVVWNVITVSLRQRLIPDRLLGRVNSVYRFFGWGTISLGALLGGALVAWGQELLSREWALRSVYLISGVLTLALLGYAARRVNTAQIRAAEAAAEAQAARDEARPTTGEASPVEETSSAVGDA